MVPALSFDVPFWVEMADNPKRLGHWGCGPVLVDGRSLEVGQGGEREGFRGSRSFGFVGTVGGKGFGRDGTESVLLEFDGGEGGEV